MSKPVTLYGISNCDTIKKARSWLTQHQIEFSFHDYRKQGLDPALLKHWVEELGWETLLNRRGTTWRQLTSEVQSSIDEASAIDIMLDNPAIIKRPLLVKDEKRYVGFSDDTYSQILLNNAIRDA